MRYIRFQHGKEMYHVQSGLNIRLGNSYWYFSTAWYTVPVGARKNINRRKGGVYQSKKFNTTSNCDYE